MSEIYRKESIGHLAVVKRFYGDTPTSNDRYWPMAKLKTEG